jgi:hypothetical protein
MQLSLQVQGRLAGGTVIAASGDLDFGTVVRFGHCGRSSFRTKNIARVWPCAARNGAGGLCRR